MVHREGVYAGSEKKGMKLLAKVKIQDFQSNFDINSLRMKMQK